VVKQEVKEDRKEQGEREELLGSGARGKERGETDNKKNRWMNGWMYPYHTPRAGRLF
jgi:hypothetical protein